MNDAQKSLGALMTSTLVFASDHAGVSLKKMLKNNLDAQRISVLDVGTFDEASVDYPDFAQKAIEKLLAQEAEIAVLICGSGIGMSIAANRHPGIRAALCVTEEMAKLSREHNNANVLVLGARLISEKTAQQILNTFLSTAFLGGRHEQRISKLN